MRLLLVLALLLPALPASAAETAHPDLLRLEQDLTRKQAEKSEGRVTAEEYREWAAPFSELLEDTAARVPPSHANAAVHARVAAMLGGRVRARSLLDQALIQSPDSPVLLRTKAQLLFEQNDFTGAAQYGLQAWEKSGGTDKSAWALYQMSKGRSAPSGAGPSPSPDALRFASQASASHADGMTLPGSQLPRGFRVFSEPPPPPGSDPSMRLEPAGLPAVIDEPVLVKPATVDLSGPRKVDSAYRGTGADAQVWTAAYSDGARFEIVAPNTPSSTLRFHTVAQAADSARYLPSSARAMVKQIILSPGPNPDDAYWSATYNQPNFHSYMTAGAAGIIRIYPNRAGVPLPNDNFMRGTLIHETGHTWANRTWGPDRRKGKWAEWRAAMAADRAAISEYAKSSIAEDFAETFQAYWSLKGTPAFLARKAALPHRFAMLEKEVK